MRDLVTAALGLFVAGVGSSALAQDGGWSGPYIGGHVGYAFGHDDDGETTLFDTNLDGGFNDTVRTAAGANAFSPGFCDGRARGRTPAEGCKGDEKAIDYGLRAGYDFAFGNFILGGVAEVSQANVADGTTSFSTTPAYYTFTREVRWLAAARARAGYAFKDALLYATGGFAYADVDHRFATSNTANTFTQKGDDDTTGYQLGAGAELKVSPRISLGAEYLYTSLEDDDYVVRSGPPAPATNPFLLVNSAGTDLRRSSEDFEFSSVRFTVNYRFGK